MGGGAKGLSGLSTKALASSLTNLGYFIFVNLPSNAGNTVSALIINSHRKIKLERPKIYFLNNLEKTMSIYTEGPVKYDM